MSFRERLNSDPKLQVGFGVLVVLVVGFLLLGRGGGKEAPVEPTAAAAETGAPVTAEAGAPVTGEVSATAESSSSPAALAASVPKPSLPAGVVDDYRANKVVALLFVRDGGVDDRVVAEYARSFAAGTSHNVAFSVVPVKSIARYGAITLGLGVQRVPALVVLRPKKLSGGRLEGSVLYGYQTPSSITQALTDATYHGPEGSYHPG